MSSSDQHESTLFQDAIILVAFLVAGLFYAWLLRNSHGQTGILPHYNQFIEFFRSGFQRSTGPSPSFPLWGYALVVFLFPDFFSRTLFQTLVHSVVLFSIFVCFRHLVAGRSLRVVLLVLLLAPASFACAPPSQPYSLYADCVIVSLLALANSKLLFSALMFGVALNFRSEAYLLAPVVAAVSVLTRALDWKSAAKWLVVIYACMIPWAAYTYYNEGIPRITSSNAGQTLIAGLGTLTDNKWGATGTDDDPLIETLLQKNGAAGISGLSSRGDRILKAEFFRLVLADPAEYWRKIAYQFRRIVWRETSSGTLWLTDQCVLAGCLLDPVARKALARNSVLFAFLVHADRASLNLAKVVALFGYIGAPLLALYGLLKRRPSLYLLNMWVGYSFSLFLVGYFIKTYSANLFPVLALNVVLLASVVRDMRHQYLDQAGDDHLAGSKLTRV